MSQTTYMIQTIRDGHLQRHYFADDKEWALMAACVLLHLWVSECDRATRETLNRLWWEHEYAEEIRTWNEGRFKDQVYVFQVTVDSPSEVFEELVRE